VDAYVDAQTHGVNMYFTIDTGASKTVLCKGIYYKISPALRPPLKQTATLSGAGGDIMKEYGKANFEVILGPLKRPCCCRYC
jgi:hypothetical protein